MKVRFFGHNCFLLKDSDISILIDPWFNTEGAFFGSWFQWPINHKLINEIIEELKKNKKNILYISHEHQDHFDIKTLNKIVSYFDECIIPQYQDKFLKNNLIKIGFKIKEIEDSKKYFLSENSFIELMIVDVGVNHDSTAIIKLGHQIFVNQNDCKIFDRLPYLENKKIDFYAVQFSGATWYPVCYKIPDEEKEKISRKKVLSKLIAIKNAIKIIKPKYYFPSAGPAIFPFLNEGLSRGKGNIFIHQPELSDFLKNSDTKLFFLKPGDIFKDSIKHSPILPPTNLELKKIKNTLTCIFENLPNEIVNFNLLKKEIDLRLAEIKDLVFEECPNLIFDWGKDSILIDLNKKISTRLNGDTSFLQKNYVHITASPSYFNLMANKEYRWQDIYLSLRANIKRKPDIFNTFVNIFIFSDVTNIRSGFKTTLNINEGRIIVVDPKQGKNYEINRYCPHNGADLKNAKIDDDGNLICPRHNWLFNLKDKGKCKTTNMSIKAKEISNVITLCENVSLRLTKKN